MTLTERQEKILNALVKEYICLAEPVSSKLLKKRAGLDVSPATIRNDFQELTEAGYIEQPHTSAGRVPTEKAYRHFVDELFENEEKLFSEFIFKEIKITKQQIEDELKLAEELTKSLEEFALNLNIADLLEKDTLFQVLIKIGPSRMSYGKNISLINSLIRELEDF